MKKLLSVVALIAILTQFIPTIEVSHAQQAYDDLFDSGDIPLVDFSGSALAVFDASNEYTSNTTSTNTNAVFVLTGPQSQLFVITHDLSSSGNNSVIECYKPDNNYGTTGAAVTCDNGHNVTLSSTTQIDPDDGSTSTPGGDVLTDQLPINGAVGPNGDLWILFTFDYNTLSQVSSHYVAQVTASSGYSTINVYDMTFGDDLAYDYGGLSLAIDHLGDVWVGSATDGVAGQDNNKVYCLDSSNSYQVCTGTNFDIHGGLTTTTDSPWQVMVDANNDIIVTSANNELIKFTRSDSFNATSLDLDTIEPSFITGTYAVIDNNNNVWVSSGPISTTTNYLACVENDVNFDSKCTGTSTLSFTKNSANDNGPVFVDTNNDIWAVKNDDTTTQLYCFDSSNSYAGCTGTNFSGGALSISQGSANQTNNGDPTGAIINRLYDNSVGQSQVDVSATVDPTLAFQLSSTTCNLGSLSSSTVKTCDYTIEVDTNATSGYTLYITSDGALRTSGSETIDDITEGTTVTAGTEGYGIAVEGATTGGDAGAIYTEEGDFNDDDTPVPTTNTALFSIDTPTDASAGTDLTTITHRATISDVTEAGSYSHTITYTVVGTF